MVIDNNYHCQSWLPTPVDSTDSYRSAGFCSGKMNLSPFVPPPAGRLEPMTAWRPLERTRGDAGFMGNRGAVEAGGGVEQGENYQRANA